MVCQRVNCLTYIWVNSSYSVIHMKHIQSFLIIWVALSGFLFVPRAGAIWGIEVPTIAIPAIPTFTPTPTPTMKIFLPGKVRLVVTMTPTSTPTPTATPTPSLTVTPAASETAAAATDSSEANMATKEVEASPSPSQKPPTTQAPSNQIAFVAVIALLVAGLILQGNWTKIKKWLHDKTG
jgi:hypothetical protein